MNVRHILSITVVAMVLAPLAHAHFLWLSSDQDGRALLYFAESPLKPDYKLPEAVTKAVVAYTQTDTDSQSVALESVETDDYIGRQSDAGIVGTGVLSSKCVYGNYHGTLLTYYVKHYAGDLASATEAESQHVPEGFAFDIRPTITDKAIVLTATRDGKPLPGVSITLIDPNGEQVEKETGGDGTAKFYNVAAGNLGFVAGLSEEQEGEIDGEAYQSASHYLTLTFTNPEELTPVSEAHSETQDQPSTGRPPMDTALPELPEGLASFGAAVSDGYVYVYSGHIGDSHQHSKDHYSQQFLRMPLTGGEEWESLPLSKPLQGLALVPYEGKLYRVGGMFSRNAEDEPEDMHSEDSFAVFDPKTKEWTALVPLPEPRSSHDAVVIDGWLYVVGGWKLSGSSDGEWHDTAWKINLNNVEGGWKKLPTPPFHRRAVAASYLPDKLVVIGGIDDAGAITRDVSALDLESGEWQVCAELPGDGMQGFGVSAWNHEGKLYASGSSGVVLHLTDDGSEWIEVAQHSDPRFFHRLLPAGPGRLLMIAGASMQRRGHVADSEWVELPSN